MSRQLCRRACLVLVSLAAAWLSACSSPAPVDDGRAGIPGRLERASRAQDELDRSAGGR